MVANGSSPSRNAVRQADIAAELGISQVAVSKALRNHPGISEAMRAKVRQTARRLGYRPNLIARSLARDCTQMVGYLAPSASGTFLNRLEGGIHVGLEASGYHLLVAAHHSRFETDDEEVNTFLDYHVDGIVAIPKAALPWERTLYASVIGGPTPVVFLNQDVDLPGSVCVFSDGVGGMRSAVAHVAEHGHRAIGLVVPDWPHDTTVQRRLQGYREGMNAVSGQPCVLRYPAVQPTAEAVEAFLREHPELTAVAAYNDGVAVEVVRAARALGLRVPEDLSVVGFGDDIPYRELMRTPLTTVDQQPRRLGRQAVDLLLALMRGEAVEPRHVVPTELVPGASVARPSSTPANSRRPS